MLIRPSVRLSVLAITRVKKLGIFKKLVTTLKHTFLSLCIRYLRIYVLQLEACLERIAKNGQNRSICSIDRYTMTFAFPIEFMPCISVCEERISIQLNGNIIISKRVLSPKMDSISLYVPLVFSQFI